MSELFNDLYDRELQPSLLKIDSFRKTAKNYLILLLCILGSLIFLPVAKKLQLTGSLSSDQLTLIGFAIAFLAAVVGVLFYSKFKTYQIIFKKNVVEKLIKTLFVGLDYKSNQAIHETTYKDSQLFPKKYDVYRGEDYCFGKIGPLDFEFSELQTSYKSATSGADGGSQTRWHTIFHGFFAHVDLHKNISKRTFIFPVVPESLLGEVFAGALKKTNGVLESRGQLVKIENPKFEKDFIVFADEPSEARDLLTPKIQECLLILREKFFTLPCVALINNRLFFALQNNADHFEPRIWNSISKSEIYFFYELIQTLITIAQELGDKKT